jgi:hypothetical protein
VQSYKLCDSNAYCWHLIWCKSYYEAKEGSNDPAFPKFSEWIVQQLEETMPAEERFCVHIDSGTLESFFSNYCKGTLATMSNVKYLDDTSRLFVMTVPKRIFNGLFDYLEMGEDGKDKMDVWDIRSISNGEIMAISWLCRGSGKLKTVRWMTNKANMDAKEVVYVMVCSNKISHN